MTTDLDALLISRRLEQLIEPWDRPDSPGIRIAVLRDGAIVADQAAGLASLELGVPIGPGTCFRVASVTKQFTCAAILLLAAEGRLGLDDDIREHLSQLPELPARITVRHLMHNTSGLRDMLEVMRLGGMDLGMPCEPADIMAAVCRAPGPDL